MKAVILRIVETADGRNDVPLLERAGMKISVHVYAAERPFDRIDLAVLVAIELLKMIIGEVRRLWIRHTSGLIVGARIVSLCIDENAIGHEIRSRLHDNSFTRRFLGGLDDPVWLPSGIG